MISIKSIPLCTSLILGVAVFSSQEAQAFKEDNDIEERIDRVMATHPTYARMYLTPASESATPPQDQEEALKPGKKSKWKSFKAKVKNGFKKVKKNAGSITRFVIREVVNVIQGDSILEVNTRHVRFRI